MIRNYLQILQDSLRQKLEILDKIEAKSLEQAAMYRAHDVSLQEIDEKMEVKAQLIEELEALDNGFESVYEKIRTELIPHRDEYKEEIRQLQALITEATEKSAGIQAIEARNKAETEAVFNKERKALQSKRTAMSIASDYYQNMNKIKNVSPQFLDRKK